MSRASIMSLRAMMFNELAQMPKDVDIARFDFRRDSGMNPLLARLHPLTSIASDSTGHIMRYVLFLIIAAAVSCIPRSAYALEEGGSGQDETWLQDQLALISRAGWQEPKFLNVDR